MWLPTRDTMDLGFEPGVYNHPVVVLSPMLSAGEVDFFPASSASIPVPKGGRFADSRSG